MFKKMFGSVAALAVLTVGAVVPTAASQSPVVSQTESVDWALSSEVCPNLPPDTTVTGSGTLTLTTITNVKDGVTTVRNVAQATGTATDNHGNSYRFHYGNIDEGQNSVASPHIYTGTMVDQFSLSGNGPANLSNGFKGTTSFDAATGEFLITSVLWMRGDPVTTPVVTSVCDPL